MINFKNVLEQCYQIGILGRGTAPSFSNPPYSTTTTTTMSFLITEGRTSWTLQLSTPLCIPQSGYIPLLSNQSTLGCRLSSVY